jgi:hypothetical protein
VLALGLRGSGRLGLTGRRWNGRPNVASATSTSSGAKSIVNLAAAHAIGIAIPESFLLRATQVIERVRFVTGVSSGVRRKTARSFQPESASSRVAAFITLLGAATAWPPLAVCAQQNMRWRAIGPRR